MAEGGCLGTPRRAGHLPEGLLRPVNPALTIFRAHRRGGLRGIRLPAPSALFPGNTMAGGKLHSFKSFESVAQIGASGQGFSFGSMRLAEELARPTVFRERAIRAGYLQWHLGSGTSCLALRCSAMLAIQGLACVALSVGCHRTRSRRRDGRRRFHNRRVICATNSAPFPLGQRVLTGSRDKSQPEE